MGLPGVLVAVLIGMTAPSQARYAIFPFGVIAIWSGPSSSSNSGKICITG